MKKYILYVLLVAFSFSLISCGFYSFTGASVPANVKTYQVNRFENNALLGFNTKPNQPKFGNFQWRFGL